MRDARGQQGSGSQRGLHIGAPPIGTAALRVTWLKLESVSDPQCSYCRDPVCLVVGRARASDSMATAGTNRARRVTGGDDGGGLARQPAAPLVSNGSYLRQCVSRARPHRLSHYSATVVQSCRPQRRPLCSRNVPSARCVDAVTRERSWRRHTSVALADDRYRPFEYYAAPVTPLTTTTSSSTYVTQTHHRLPVVVAVALRARHVPGSRAASLMVPCHQVGTPT